MNIGKAIKLCRTQKDMKQSDLAAQAGISVSYLSLLERGKRNPNLSTVQRIADSLNVPINILMFLAADPHEVEEINQDTVEKLSSIALKLMKETVND